MRRVFDRHRLGLMVFAGLSLLFVWDTVHAQGFRPRGTGMPGMPGMPPRPPFGGGMGGGFQTVYSCSKCGNEMAANSGSILDKPSSCSRCGVRFINGGLGGSGQSVGGNPAIPPAGMPGMPGMPPMTPNPAPQNLAPGIPPQMPITPAQPIAPATPGPISGAAPNNPVAPASAPTSARSSWLIPGVIAIVVLGLVGVGGVWMMVSSLKGDDSPPRRSRSRRRRDDDDDD